MVDMLLFISLIVLSLYDIVSTYIALKTGKASEMNPVMKWLIDKLTVVPALTGTKVIFLGIVWFFFVNTLILFILNFIYLLIAMNNTYVLWRLYKEKW